MACFDVLLELSGVAYFALYVEKILVELSVQVVSLTGGFLTIQFDTLVGCLHSEPNVVLDVKQRLKVGCKYLTHSNQI